MRKIILLAVLALSLQAQAQSPSTESGWLGDLRDRIQIHGFAQGGYTYQDVPGTPTGNKTSTFEMKRVILIASGQITDKWSFLLMHEPVSGRWQEYYTAYRFNKAFGARIGQMKNLLTIENPMNPSQVELIALSSQATTYMAGIAGDAAYGNQIGRDLGLVVYGDLLKDHLHYELGLFNGQGINVKDGNTHKDFQGRVTYDIANGMSLSTSWWLGKGHAIADHLYVENLKAGQDYTRNRWSIGGQFQSNNGFYLRAEYLMGKDATAKSQGYYAVLRFPLCKKLEAVASYDFMCYNKDWKAQQTNVVAGLQYWFYKNCRLQLQYTHCDPKGGDDFGKLEMQTQISF